MAYKKEIYKYHNMLDLIKDGTHKNIVPYMEEPVLYLFIIDIPTPNHEIIIKPGYTADIVKRMKSLKDEYNCNVYFIDVRFIKSERDEKKFHETLKNKFHHLIYKTTIGKNDKTELYYYHPTIIDFFNKFMPELNKEEPKDNNKQLTKEEKEIIKLFQNQHSVFIKSVINKLIKDENNITEYLRLQLRLEHSYRELKLKLEYEERKDIREHEKEMKQMDHNHEKEMKKLEIDLIKKKIELEKVIKKK